MTSYGLNSSFKIPFTGASTVFPEKAFTAAIPVFGKPENFDEMVGEICSLIKTYHFKVLGGCCGTNDVFIEKLAITLHEINKIHKT